MGGSEKYVDILIADILKARSRSEITTIMHIQRYAPLLGLLIIGGCGLTGPTYPPGALCSTSQFSVSDQFAGARRGDCRVISYNKVRISIRQEDEAVSNEDAIFLRRIADETVQAFFSRGE